MESEETDYAAWIGLDWGSEKHAICLQASGCSHLEHCSLEQNPKALHKWFSSLLTRFGGRKVAVAIEQSRGAVIHFLLGFSFVHIFRIHPKSLKNYRDALHPKCDYCDPHRITSQNSNSGQSSIIPDPLIDFGGANVLATPKRCEKIAR